MHAFIEHYKSVKIRLMFIFKVSHSYTLIVLCLCLLSMDPWAAAKKLEASVVVPPAPVRVLNQRPLAPSVTPVSSVG